MVVSLHSKVYIIKLREMLTNVLRVLVNNLFKESFYKNSK